MITSRIASSPVQTFRFVPELTRIIVSESSGWRSPSISISAVPLSVK